VRLLGGFQVERPDASEPVSNWQRRSAKSLIKLLSLYQGHALHREQVLDLLWPGHDLDHALNSLGKALHAARRAIEPELLPRQASAYLQLTDSMLALNSQRVAVDVDRFEDLAQEALRRKDVPAYESALDAYAGELLPEDRYEDWCLQRREYVAALRVRLLVGLANVLEDHGALAESSDRLRAVVAEDPAREDAHRRLMLLYVKMGMPDQAVRQFHLCVEGLRRELDLAPQDATVALYEDVLANRISEDSTHGREQAVSELRVSTVRAPDARAEMPFVGREPIMRRLCAQLEDGGNGAPGLIVLRGEAGVGTTRLLREFASTAAGRGAVVLWGGAGAHANRFDYGPFGVAVEGYVASRPEAERNELLCRYPDLAPLVPSLGMVPLPRDGESEGRHPDHVAAMAVVRLLSDLARSRRVLLVLGDLHDADSFSLGLVRYVAHLAVRRPWLIVGTVREEDVDTGEGLHRLIESTTRERICQTIELPGLSRSDCDRLVAAMLDCPVSEALREHIYTCSRGNPLFVEALVGELRQPSGPVPCAGGRQLSAVPGRVPARVRALTSMRLASMDRTARRVLELAAAANTNEISLSKLRTAAAALDPPVSRAALYDALDYALHKRLLEERRAGYAFRHPLVRCALDESLSRHRREQLRSALEPAHRMPDSEVARKDAGIPSAHAVVRRRA
jgi:DNA-binding SARP family transcriptional activator